MLHQGRRPVCLAIARSLCLLALVVQATALPLAHAWHGAALEREHAVDRVDNSGAADGANLRRAGRGQVHDAATCPLCAALAHQRSAVVSAPVRFSRPQVALATSYLAAGGWGGTEAPTAAQPRAPPARTA